MPRYETELIARAMAVLEEAAAQKGDIQTPAVRLALWALRPYADADALERFWAVTASQNPMWAAGMREAALNVVRKGLRA